LLFGDPNRAAEHYFAVSDDIVDEDRLRALEVKAAARDERLRQAVVSLLIGDPELGRDFGVAAAELGRLSTEGAEEGEAGDAALAHYLLGKNFYNGGRFREAAAHLEKAAPLPTRRLEREARRMRVIVSCALGDKAAARQSYTLWKTQEGLGAAQSQAMQRIAERCGVT
jgi:hypothetical protein